MASSTLTTLQIKSPNRHGRWIACAPSRTCARTHAHTHAYTHARTHTHARLMHACTHTQAGHVQPADRAGCHACPAARAAEPGVPRQAGRERADGGRRCWACRACMHACKHARKGLQWKRVPSSRHALVRLHDARQDGAAAAAAHLHHHTSLIYQHAAYLSPARVHVPSSLPQLIFAGKVLKDTRVTVRSLVEKVRRGGGGGGVRVWPSPGLGRGVEFGLVPGFPHTNAPSPAL